MQGSLRLGRVLGIETFLHISWFIIFVLLTSSLAVDWFPESFPGWSTTGYWLAAAASALLLLVSVLVHELAHALVARRHNLKVKGITLFIFGGVAEIEEEFKRPAVELKVAIAGPIASFLLAGLAFLLVIPFAGSKTAVEAVLDYLVWSNLLLGGFNLIPGFPLDGGRILRALVWRGTKNFERATQIASGVGQGIAYLFIIVGIVEFFTGNFFNGLWTVFIGWFLLSSAQAAYTQIRVQKALRGISVGAVMQVQPVTIPGNISLQKAVDEVFLPKGITYAPVLQGDYFAGMLSLDDITRVEQERWASTPVGYVMRLRDNVPTVAPEDDLQAVLNTMMVQSERAIPVLKDGRVIGLLSRESIVRSLEVRTRLQAREPEAVMS